MCTGIQGTHAKTKAYTFATVDNSLIIVGFLSNSTTADEENLPLFEESVKTIKISDPLDIATSETYKRFKELKSEFDQAGGWEALQALKETSQVEAAKLDDSLNVAELRKYTRDHAI